MNSGWRYSEGNVNKKKQASLDGAILDHICETRMPELVLWPR